MTGLRGRGRVLVVEDEAMVAILVEDMLNALNYEVVRTAATLDQATEAARATAVDLAVLDVNLAGAFTYPVADILLKRRIPFAFVTGYGLSGLEPAYAQIPTLQKPFRAKDLEAALSRLVESAREPE